MGIKYVQGDATRPIGDGCKVLVHICNDICKWGRGFVLAVSNKWPSVRYHYLANSNGMALGTVQFVQVEPDLHVANLIGQHDIKPGPEGEPPIRHWAVREGLQKVKEFALEHNASVHMPRIGCGLAGSTWDQMEELIRRELDEISVTVYDL
jgi:O-acetyl-ADP-ribose deacetylase (regulator of RNase III)